MAWLPKTLPDGIVQHLTTSFEMQNISDLTKAFESNLLYQSFFNQLEQIMF